MRKKKNRAGLYFVIGLVFIIGFSVLVNNVLPKEEEIEFNKINYSQYKELINSDDFQLVYFGNEDCGYCAQIEPILGKIEKEYSIKVNYVDTYTLTEENLSDISTTADVFAGKWGTPTLIAIKDGEVVSTKSGYAEYDVIKQFVSAAMIGKIEFNKISYSEYKEILESEELEIVYVGREGCGYCQIFEPILGQIQNDYSIKFNYLDTDTMTQENYEDLATTADVFAGKWGTPTLVAIKEGKVVSTKSGYVEYDVVKDFVEDLIN